MVTSGVQLGQQAAACVGAAPALAHKATVRLRRASCSENGADNLQTCKHLNTGLPCKQGPALGREMKGDAPLQMPPARRAGAAGWKMDRLPCVGSIWHRIHRILPSRETRPERRRGAATVSCDQVVVCCSSPGLWCAQRQGVTRGAPRAGRFGVGRGARARAPCYRRLWPRAPVRRLLHGLRLR